MISFPAMDAWMTNYKKITVAYAKAMVSYLVPIPWFSFPKTLFKRKLIILKNNWSRKILKTTI
jgi:hypothetical protein